MPSIGRDQLEPAHRLHPNAIKTLPRCGQGYLLGSAHVESWRGTTPTEGASPVCYPRLPKELEVGVDYPLKRNDQQQARGLNLYSRFVEAARTKQAQEDNETANDINLPASRARAPDGGRPLRLAAAKPIRGRPRNSAQAHADDDVSSDPPSR